MRSDLPVHRWLPWSLDVLRRTLHGCPAHWWLSGGWAIEHVVGTPLRSRCDLDISVLRENLNAPLEALKPAHAWAAIDDHLKPLAAHLEDPRLHNIWLTETGADIFVLQINIETGSSEGWTYRRCPSISLPWDRAVRRVHGLPTGTLATQLLWKAKDPRPRDTIDFAASLCLLSGEDRGWLARSVTRAHPESPWIRPLSGNRSAAKSNVGDGVPPARCTRQTV